MSNDKKKPEAKHPPKPTGSETNKKRRSWGKIIDPRSDQSALVPYVISPRCTALLSRQPCLQWNAAEDATHYTVNLHAEGKGIIWQTETPDTQLVYPGKPPLEVGLEYWLVVEANPGTSSCKDESPEALSFQLLNDDQGQQVQAQVQQAQQESTGDDRVLAIVQIYQRYDLRAAAIPLLETAIQQGSQFAILHKTLGDLYSTIGLFLKAEAIYQKTISLAEDADDLEMQAAVAASFGTVHNALGDRTEARDWLKQAKYGYEALGKTAKVKALEQTLFSLDQHQIGDDECDAPV